MATSYMSEPTKVVNMFSDAVYDTTHAKTKAERKAAGKRLVRTSFSLLVSFAVNAALGQALIDALRDDDDYETFLEKFWEAFWGDKYGYDGKQVSHLIRVDDYLERYINGESYESCLSPTDSKRDRIMDYKLLDRFSLAEAQVEALKVRDHVVAIADAFCEGKEDEEVPEMRELLESVQFNIMKISVSEELK